MECRVAMTVRVSASRGAWSGGSRLSRWASFLLGPVRWDVGGGGRGAKGETTRGISREREMGNEKGKEGGRERKNGP